MDEYESLSHTKWECKYHVVFIPEVPPQDAVRASCGSIWGRCSGAWPSRRRAGSKKGI